MLNQLCVRVPPDLPALHVFLSQQPHPFPAPCTSHEYSLGISQSFAPLGSKCGYCFLYGNNTGCRLHEDTKPAGTRRHQTRQIIPEPVLIFRTCRLFNLETFSWFSRWSWTILSPMQRCWLMEKCAYKLFLSKFIKPTHPPRRINNAWPCYAVNNTKY